MKTIEALEKTLELAPGTTLKELGLNPTFYRAYFNSKEAGNDLFDLNDVIWDYDVKPILAHFKEYGINEFTISSTYSRLLETVALFEKAGAKMTGLVEINSPLDDWTYQIRGERRKQRVPALHLVIGA